MAMRACHDIINSTLNHTLKCSISDTSVADTSHSKEDFCSEGTDSIIDYAHIVYCNGSVSGIGLCFALVWLAFLFTSLATTTDDFFCPSLEILAKALRLSQNVAGVTLLAFGNGAPEIFASIAGTTNDRAELVVSYLLGSGMFLTCVVAGAIMILTPFKMVERPFLRDIAFYIVALFWTFCLIWNEKITFPHSLGFICLYIVYLAVVLIAHKIYQKWFKDAPGYKQLANPPSVTVVDVDRNSNSEIQITKSGVILNGDEIMPWGGPPYVRHSWSVSGDHRDLITRHHSSLASLSERLQSLKETDSVCNPKSASTSPLEEDFKAGICESCATPESKCSRFINCVWDCPANGVADLKTLLQALNPIDTARWTESAVWYKFLQVFRSPAVVLLRVTTPVVTRWCRPLNSLHCITSPLFFVFATGFWKTNVFDHFPVWALTIVIMFFVAVFVYITSCPHQLPMYYMVFAIVEFCVSVTWIYVIANEIVAVLTTIGFVLGISDALLGLTVLAWGNSISDVVADISVAKEGYPRMGLSACFGGPLFNLLLGLGISFSTATLKTPTRTIEIAYETTTVILTGFLCASLVSSLVIVPLIKFETGRAYGIYLLTLYLVFVICIIINECGLLF